MSRSPMGSISIVFAHQATQAWTALIRSLFAAGLTIDATWPIEMELKNRMRGLNWQRLRQASPSFVGPALSAAQLPSRTYGRKSRRLSRMQSSGSGLMVSVAPI